MPINVPYVGIQTPSLMTVLSLVAGSGVTLTVDLTARTLTIVSTGTGSSTFSDNETPSGTINGTTTLFTCAAPYLAGTLHVYLNGVRQTLSVDYSETSPAAGTFTFVTAPPSGAILRVDYQKT